MLVFLSQVPSAAGPSTRGNSGSQPEIPPSCDSVGFVPLQRYSQVQSAEDMIRFLRTQLEERSQRVKNLEAELKEAHSRVEASSTREDFLFAELAAQVGDLNCEFSAPSFYSLLCSPCVFFSLNVVFCRYSQ